MEPEKPWSCRINNSLNWTTLPLQPYPWFCSWERPSLQVFTVQTAQSLLHNAWPPATRRAELCWIRCRKNAAIAAALSEGPKKIGSLCCPNPWEEHLITQVTLCMSALNLPLTREPLQTWGRQGALGGIIALAALCCFDVHPSTHPPLWPWCCYRDAGLWQAETRLLSISSSLHRYIQEHAGCL